MTSSCPRHDPHAIHGRRSGDPFPHSMEPQLRQLGLATSLVEASHHSRTARPLQQGEKLSSEKCRILKLLGVQMAASFFLGARCALHADAL